MSKAKCRECGAVARVYARNNITVDVSDIYLACRNDDCGHRWVARMAYSHSVQPSIKAGSDIIVAHLQRLPADELLKLLKQALANQSATVH